MTVKCTQCGGTCRRLPSGEYQCEFCGTKFGKDDMFSKTSEKQSFAAKRNSGANVFEQNINGILEIRWQAGGYVYSGSGFLISSNGYAVTNTHVVTYEDGRSCRSVTVKLCGRELSASVEVLGDNGHGSGNGIDLALIKLSHVPAGAKVLEFEDFENVRIGEQVYVIGNSLGYGTCITSGIVSDKARLVDGKVLLMTDCAVNGGNSGGPIFNESGKVIGAIVSGIDKAEGMNFAIPANSIQEFLRQNKKSTLNFMESRKALAPCPRCGSKNTIVENGIFVCLDCDFEGG